MKIEKVLETVFLEEWNTTALILETRIVVMLFHKKYMSRQECFEYIHEYCKGWIQTSEQFKEAKKNGKEIGIKTDPLLPYENLYDDLIIYASKKFKTKCCFIACSEDKVNAGMRNETLCQPSVIKSGCDGCGSRFDEMDIAVGVCYCCSKEIR